MKGGMTINFRMPKSPWRKISIKLVDLYERFNGINAKVQKTSGDPGTNLNKRELKETKHIKK